MLLAIMGDIHGDIPGMYKYLLEYEHNKGVKFDAVIQVGDFGIFLPPQASSHDLRKQKDYLTYIAEGAVVYPFTEYWFGLREAPILTYVCPGNHESWSVLNNWGDDEGLGNLSLLRNGGTLTLKDGTTIGSIWGNFSWKSWQNPERVLTARRNYDKQFSHKAMHILKSSVDCLAEASVIDILITHDCPHGMAPSFGQPPDFIKQQLGLDSDEQAAGCPGFNELHRKLNPKYHFFGHFHRYATVSPKDYPVKVIALGNFNEVPDSALYVLDTEEL